MLVRLKTKIPMYQKRNLKAEKYMKIGKNMHDIKPI